MTYGRRFVTRVLGCGQFEGFLNNAHAFLFLSCRLGPRIMDGTLRRNVEVQKFRKPSSTSARRVRLLIAPKLGIRCLSCLGPCAGASLVFPNGGSPSAVTQNRPMMVTSKAANE